MCQHPTPCPDANAPDAEAAIVLEHSEVCGYSRLCNGVITFTDTGEILPTGEIIQPHRGPALHTTS